jgi:hypothetical protein
VTTTEKGSGIVSRALALVRGGICWSNALETARVESEAGAGIADRTLELMQQGVRWSEAIQIARVEAAGTAVSDGAGNDCDAAWVGM